MIRRLWYPGTRGWSTNGPCSIGHHQPSGREARNTRGRCIDGWCSSLGFAAPRPLDEQSQGCRNQSVGRCKSAHRKMSWPPQCRRQSTVALRIRPWCRERGPRRGCCVVFSGCRIRHACSDVWCNRHGMSRAHILPCCMLIDSTSRQAWGEASNAGCPMLMMRSNCLALLLSTLGHGWMARNRDVLNAYVDKAPLASWAHVGLRRVVVPWAMTCLTPRLFNWLGAFL